MTWTKSLVAAALLLAALVLQTSVLTAFAWDGVVVNLVLLAVVALALTQSPQFAVVAGFAGGVLLDLAPPADHVAGRWTLALLLVAYVAARVRPDGRPSSAAVVGTVAACSFIGSSVFALTGALLGDLAADTGQVLEVIGIGLVLDVLLTPIVLPPLLALLARFRPDTRPLGRLGGGLRPAER